MTTAFCKQTHTLIFSDALFVAAYIGMKEWMKRICPCFTPSRIALMESARETVSLPRLVKLSTLFFFLVSSKTLYNIHVT